jgi:hypothetical protein
VASPIDGEAKLTEQRRFVTWYDAQPKDPGGRPPETAHSTVSGFVDLAVVLGLDPADERGIHAAEVMISRWRRALAGQQRPKQLCQCGLTKLDRSWFLGPARRRRAVAQAASAPASSLLLG